MKSFSALFAQFGTKCPLTAGKYKSNGADVTLPTFGGAFDKVFEVLIKLIIFEKKDLQLSKEFRDHFLLVYASV